MANYINALQAAEQKINKLSLEERKQMVLKKYPQQYLEDMEEVRISIDDGVVFAILDAKTFNVISVEYYSNDRYCW